MRTVTKTVPIPTWDDTDWEYVSLFDFYPVGRGSTIQELEGVMHRVRTDWDNVKSNERTTDGEISEGIYYNLENVVPTKSQIDLVEYWGKIPKEVVTGEESDRFRTFEGVITVVMDVDKSWENMLQGSHSEKTGEIADLDDGNGIPSVAIRLQENPFWHGERPFRSCPYTPVDDEFYGIGMIEPIVDKWHELNTTIRQLIDNKTLQLLNPTIEEASANVQRDVKLIKNPRIKADDVNAVQPLRINDFSANGWRVVASLKDEIRRGSGALESIQGVPLKNERTSATEFQGTIQQAGIRLKNRIRLIDERLFKKFLDRSYQNDMQFAEFERIVKVIGKDGAEFKRVKPEDIWGTFDIVTQGPTQFESKVIQANKITNFLAIAARAPQVANIPFLLKKAYIALDIGPEHEASKVVITPPDENTEREIEAEITALSLGQRVIAKVNQDHAKHIQEKVAASKDLIAQDLMTEEAFKAFQENVDGHLSFQKSSQPGLNQIAQNGPEVPIRNTGTLPTVNPTEAQSIG